MDSLFIPACIAIPIAAAVVVLLIRIKMSSKGDEKKHRKEKKERAPLKPEAQQAKSSQSPVKKEKTSTLDAEATSSQSPSKKIKSNSESKNTTSSSSTSSKEPVCSVGKKCDTAASTIVSANPCGNTSSASSEKVDQPPAKPKRKTKGRNPISVQVEESAKLELTKDRKPSLEQGSSIEEPVASSVSKSVPEAPITKSVKSSEKKDKQKMSSSKSVDQSNLPETADKLAEDRKASLPGSLNEKVLDKPARSIKTKQKAPAPEPTAKTTIDQAEVSSFQSLSKSGKKPETVSQSSTLPKSEPKSAIDSVGLKLPKFKPVPKVPKDTDQPISTPETQAEINLFRKENRTICCDLVEDSIQPSVMKSIADVQMETASGKSMPTTPIQTTKSTAETCEVCNPAKEAISPPVSGSAPHVGQVELKITEPSPAISDQQPHRKLAGFLEKSSDTLTKSEKISTTMADNARTSVAPSSGNTQIRVLTLNSGEHQQENLYRLQKGFVLQMRPGPSLFGKKTNVFTNCPKSLSESFDRTKYRKLEWQNDSQNRGDDTALFVDIQIQSAGSFHYYLTINDCTDKKTADASGYFLVDPVLTTGEKGDLLPQDCIQCQTFLAKCLGTLDRWPQTLQVAKESGYNMIHFTPVQELGGSRSGYSIKNQLKLNPEFSTAKKKYSMEDLKHIVDMMDNEWKMLSITDIVLNHTAKEAEWLKEHPECAYNLVNSPHLRPAYILDRVIWHFTLEIIEGKWESKGIPKNLLHEHQVQALEGVLHNEIMHKYKIEEYFLLDVDSTMKKFRSKLESRRRPSLKFGSLADGNVVIIQDPLWRRFMSTVDLDLAVLNFNFSWADCNEADRINQCCQRFRRHLEDLNKAKGDEIRYYISGAVNCILGAVRYERLQEDGPKIKSVSTKHPLVPLYFTQHEEDSSVAEEEEASFGPSAKYIKAHNGWVMGDDPLENFAEPGSDVCLRRQLNAWGDCVKLRYGDKPEDCPYLWDHMRRYVEETARIFHGIRLDNCHSTPIHVAEYLLDCARMIRPNLYVIAELFTSSDGTDNVFVNRLGISSLVREAMSAPNSHEEGRLVYGYGGEPVGAFVLPPVRPLVPSIAHAMFLDITHDNQSPCQTRTAWDMLPSTSLVNMACCASGSSRGYDEIVPHHINVVYEERKYPSWTDKAKPQRGTVNASSGIIAAKRILNDLHYDLGASGFSQVFVDQVTTDIVTVTRHNPLTHESVVLVAFTSFYPPAHINRNASPLRVEGKVQEILFELRVTSKNDNDRRRQIPGDFVKDETYINGVNAFDVEVRKSLQPEDATFVKRLSAPGDETSVFKYTDKFTPGSVIAFKIGLLPAANTALRKIRSLLSDFGYKQKISEIENFNKGLLEIVNKLSLSDLNRILYRCDQEERDEGRGWDGYSIPGIGSFNYCGLQGIITVLSDIRANNDLGHPLCDNLRKGDWLMNYVADRLELESSTKDLALWLRENFHLISLIPRYLIPAYFDALLTAVYLTLINHAWNSMSKFISTGSGFAKALALCSVQFCGVAKSALLPLVSPNLKLPRPPKEINDDDKQIETSVTISAGLPHFCVGYMRNWGRDTFIALPGNLLVTGRYNEARWIILAFASTLRHGLIPNLLDGGVKARFNCRDAVWFWLYSIQKYVDCAPNGHEILKDKVCRIFPTDDSEAVESGARVDNTLEDLIQEALDRHFQGLDFVERNAGFQIDCQMTEQGFSNTIGVCLDTGFPFGGNEHNCGTWMDKMGSSSIAGNKGKPATSRNGSAVEIVGLCKAAVKFLARMHSEGKYSFEGVSRTDKDGNNVKWSYTFWDNLIKESFERHFWVNVPTDADNESVPEYVNQRGIYKDTVGSKQPWADYQLRCNFPIALAVAPDLVSTENGKIALAKAEHLLLGPLGIKTLDPTDWAYRGDYYNSNNGDDPSVAQGFNYHQGPEWLWPVGWFLRAKLAMATKTGSRDAVEEALSQIKSILAPRFTHLLSSPWRSLPELTNSNGAVCNDSNPAQAWSTGCLLEVLWEMNQIGEQFNIKT